MKMIPRLWDELNDTFNFQLYLFTKRVMFNGKFGELAHPLKCTTDKILY